MAASGSNFAKEEIQRGEGKEVTVLATQVGRATVMGLWILFVLSTAGK